MRFKEQVAIVTGGTRGIGRGIVTAFLREGATVYATYRSNDEAANAFKDSLGELGLNLKLAKFDVTNKDGCEKFMDGIAQENDQIHILVNNSGIRKDNLVATMDEADWDQVLDTNLKGTYLMTKFAILKMMKARYGRIINISSIGGHLGLPGQANYAASKAAQIAFSKSVSKEIAKRKITINNVCPGFIETELIEDLDADLVKNYKAQVPMKRFGTTDEVAHAVLFLADENASYITGASLDISGGL